MSHNSIYISFLRKLLIDMLMSVIFLILISFALWLIWLTFFRVYFDTGITNESSNDYNLASGVISRSEDIKRFHNISTQESHKRELTSTCVLCHQDLPHFKSREKRAFLNAHGYFMVCEVCHINQDNNLVVNYQWKDKITGKYSNTVQSIGASQITPVRVVNSEVHTLEKDDVRSIVVKYLKTNEPWNLTKNKDIVWDVSHKQMLNNPVTCVDCHTNDKKPFLPFSELNYTSARVEELTRIEVAGMVKKYEHFYLPNLSSKHQDK